MTMMMNNKNGVRVQAGRFSYAYFYYFTRKKGIGMS